MGASMSIIAGSSKGLVSGRFASKRAVECEFDDHSDRFGGSRDLSDTDFGRDYNRILQTIVGNSRQPTIADRNDLLFAKTLPHHVESSLQLHVMAKLTFNSDRVRGRRSAWE